MRIAANNGAGSSVIKVQIRKVLDETIECKHITSNFQIKAFYRNDMHLSEGQVVLVEFRKTANGGGYIVIDDLMEEIDAKVLEAQHLIADGLMYTSIIAEILDTRKRMHSLVSSSNKLFSETSIIIKGDTVKLRINNGALFNIKY